MSFIDTDCANILESYGAGTVGVDIFAGLDQPDKPNSAILLVATGSYQANMPSLDYSFLTLQVTVRDSEGNKQGCDSTTEIVIDILHGLVNHTQGTSRYVQIFQNSGPISILEDGTMRPKNIVNFYALRTTS
jgi:hypothetical protein